MSALLIAAEGNPNVSQHALAVFVGRDLGRLPSSILGALAQTIEVAVRSPIADLRRVAAMLVREALAHDMDAVSPILQQCKETLINDGCYSVRSALTEA